MKKLEASKVHLFLLERYKFILTEIRHLNEAVYKSLAFFQASFTAIVGACAVAIASLNGEIVNSEQTYAFLSSLKILVALISGFQVVSTLAIVASWLDYRNDEVKLLETALGPGYRQPAKLSNFWRWGETYLVLFYLSVGIGFWLVMNNLVLPSLE